MHLHCPYCGGKLIPDADPDAAYGLMRCRCAVYPVVEGIRVLKPASEALQEAIQAGAHHQALQLAAYAYVPRNARTRLRKVVDFGRDNRLPGAGTVARLHQRRWHRQVSAGAAGSFRAAARALRPRMYADYLIHRYANPSFLAAVGVMHTLETISDLPAPRVLDLACGTAHSSFVLAYLYPHLEITATDHDFINLLLARWYLAPRATLVCCDHEAPLPFADNDFDAVFCLDAFHYIRSKRALVRELARLMRPEALWLFPHLHNAAAFNFTEGMPLTAEGYLECFAEVNPRLFDEAQLLSQVAQQDGVDLQQASPAANGPSAQAFTLVASGRAEVWKAYTNLRDRLHQAPDRLRLNPIFRQQSGQLEMHWPNAMLAEECRAVVNYLPETYALEHPEGPGDRDPVFLWVPLPAEY